MCANRAAVKVAGYEVGPIARARESVQMSAHTSEEKRNTNAFFDLVQRKCGQRLRCRSRPPAKGTAEHSKTLRDASGKNDGAFL